MRVLRVLLSPAVRLSAVIALLFANMVSAADDRKISNVVRKGNFAYVYDEKGAQFLTLSAGDGIVGFTASTISIRRGNFIYVYNQKGSQISTIPAGQ